jgi:hypothetical protein
VFTLEESTLLRRMIRVVAWLLVACLIAGGWAGARWIRHHHRHHGHQVSRAA